MQRLARFIYFRIMGWKMVGKFPGHIDKFVIAVVPHTSYIDFFLGLLIRKVWNEPINFVGKKSLFAFPFGWIFKQLGGEPIDRSKNNDIVAATIKVFKKREKFRLTIAPEGTRKKVERWKTGFYYIAKGAKVPIVLIAFDFGKKQVKISEPLFTTNDKEADFKVYKNFFEEVEGYVTK
ncbi:1-acyl-sn-glycerol-3-phosphate acyltransferase [Zobellia sp.]|nr:1-acyl-sn-glycerol-3-phosphate acyltransferase [Zobellia sp.]